MKNKRIGVCRAIFEDKLYALGGLYRTIRLNTVEYLDLNDMTKGWCDAPPMNMGRNYFGAYCVRDQDGPKLVVFGGCADTSTGSTERSEYFDGFHWFPTSNNLARPIYWFSMTSVNMTSSLRDSILDGMMQRSTTTRPQALN